MMRKLLNKKLPFVAALAINLLLVGCGDSVTPGENIESNNNNTGNEYNGPVPASEEVQAFRLEFWENLNGEDRCGECHNATGESPSFARFDDVNLAYEQALTIVDQENPEESAIVTKVAGGHNCWKESDAICGELITVYINNWLGGDGGAPTKSIDLDAPALNDPGSSKDFPENSTLFSGELYGLLTQYCADCHAEGAQTPQAPYFAGTDVNAAYLAAQSKINLEDPSKSRLVVRLEDEFHNCWSDCDTDATEMENAITAIADTIDPTEVDSDLVISKAMVLARDGIVSSQGGRHENDVIALYEFQTGEGNIAYDTSGISPELDLTLSRSDMWVGGWGVRFTEPTDKAQGTTQNSKKLYDLITAAGEYSVEAWVTPANVTQVGPARIVSYSAGPSARNFTLGQTMYNYNFMHRSSTTDANGEPSFDTNDDDEDLQATLQHVVLTFDPANGRQIYVNGEHTDDVDETESGLLNDWDDTFALILGNEASSDEPWAGTIRMVAIHNRALTPTQILENFEVGVGEKFYLLFSIADLIGEPESYIVFEVSQFDSYSYLFNAPFFVNLNTGVVPAAFNMNSMRIGINGQEAEVGQAFATLNMELGGDGYSAEGQPISRLGTIIKLDKGPEADEFFLSFGEINGRQNAKTTTVPATAVTVFPDAEVPDIGLRTFEEINASMSAVTGVSTANTNVFNTFSTIRQQLPTAENIEGFISAHQIAVSQLAIEYCNELVNDNSLRSAFFTGFTFTDLDTSFNESGRAALIDSFMNNMVGTNINTQPSDAAIEGEINSLITRLTECEGGCDSDRTETVVKATCAAVLGSAAVLLQ